MPARAATRIRPVASAKSPRGVVMWSDRRFLDLVGAEQPIVQAPMAGAMDWQLVAAVSQAGGLGSLPCAMLSAVQAREQIERIRAVTDRPFNVNFFCHQPPTPNNAREDAWRGKLAVYYRELGLDPDAPVTAANRAPFDATMCELMLELKPKVVSFHFGLPEAAMLKRLKAAGIVIMSSATTVAEARWLAEHGVDAIIAQGYEAGGHRGMFLSDVIANQVGTLALVPQVVDAVRMPVIAAGGITDARGMAAALVLGAAAVQMGTAFLFAPEAKPASAHRTALKRARDDGTAITNMMTGRPARSLYNRVMRDHGPIGEAPAFPLAANALAPLRAKAEAAGSGDFSPLWAGQAAALGREMPAAELTRTLAAETQARLRAVAGEPGEHRLVRQRQ
jgi:nitronate monooxygenase